MTAHLDTHVDLKGNGFSLARLPSYSPIDRRTDQPAVLHVALSLEPGGLEHVVLALTNDYLQQGGRVGILCVERRGLLADELSAKGVPVWCCDKAPGVRPSTVHRVREAVRRFRPEIIHTHQIGPLFYAGIAARMATSVPRPAVVHTEHGKHFSTGTATRRRWLGRTAARLADQFVCVSRDIAADAVRERLIADDDAAVIYNGVDASRYEAGVSSSAQLRHELRQSLRIPDEARVIGTVGRLAEIKRQDVLLAAIALLPQDVHVLLVGDGPLREELESTADQLGLGERAHFVGYQRDPLPFMRAMDAFALTSRSEGIPLAVLEAWAAGLPVAVTRVGGLPELVTSDLDGLLFEPNSPAAAAEAFERLLTGGDEIARLIAAGHRRFCEHFSLGRMCRAYCELYRSLLGTRS